MSSRVRTGIMFKGPPEMARPQPNELQRLLGPDEYQQFMTEWEKREAANERLRWVWPSSDSDGRTDQIE
jgi:hypothetical protein